jgi:tetratricopeptide (TPR) repeat protein
LTVAAHESDCNTGLLSVHEQGAFDVIRKSVFCACLLIGAAMAAKGQSLQENVDKCRSRDADASVTGCTALIEGGLLTKLIATGHLPAIYYNRGNAYRRKGDYDRAIQDYDQSIRLGPNDPDVYYARGDAYLSKGNFERAIQDLNQAVHLNPNYVLAYLDRGTAYDDKGDYDHAIQDLSEAIRLAPSDGAAYNARGYAYNKKGDYDRAIQDFNEAIQLSPNFEKAYYDRGNARINKGDYDQAIQDFNEAIRLSPKDALAYNNRGVAYMRKKDYDRAIQEYNQAIGLNSNNVTTYVNRGYAYLAQSNLTAAIADFMHTISAAPSSGAAVSAVLILHVIMKRQGRDDTQQLAQVATAADLSKWPGPMLKLDMGQITANDVLTAAASPGPPRQKWQVCEANYFIAEDALFHHQRETALGRLKAARSGCPKAATNYALVLVELKRLGASTAPAN